MKRFTQQETTLYKICAEQPTQKANRGGGMVMSTEQEIAKSYSEQSQSRGLGVPQAQSQSHDFMTLMSAKMSKTDRTPNAFQITWLHEHKFKNYGKPLTTTRSCSLQTRTISHDSQNTTSVQYGKPRAQPDLTYYGQATYDMISQKRHLQSQLRM